MRGESVLLLSDSAGAPVYTGKNQASTRRNKEQGEKNRSGPEVGLNALNQITALTEPGSHLAT